MKTKTFNPKHEFENVRALLEWAGETNGANTAFSFKASIKGEIIKKNYSEMRDDVRGLASKLLAMGCAGKHCVLIGKLSYDWAVTYFATLSIGAVLVPLDRDWTAADLADTCKKADASFLFCDEDIKDKAETIESENTLSVPTVFLQSKSSENTLASLIAEGKELFAADPAPYFNAEIDNRALALLVFTSGTTGKGKGVMLCQDAIISDICSALPHLDVGLRTVGVLPPHHTFGSTIMLLGHALLGGEIFISGGIRYVAKELKEHEPEHMVLVPLYLETFYRKIQANLKEKGKEKLVERMIKLSNALRKVGIDIRKKVFAEIRAAFGGKVKTIVCGGAPINPEILAFFDSIGISILNGYGITECAPIISVNRSGAVVAGSVGHVLDINEVVIDEPNEDGEGEILTRGRNVMLGYYKDEAATADAMREDGFFRTGDYGKVDKNGVLFITGRKKNLIILSNGKNVYPEEIENELVATPGVLDIIVYEGQSKRGMEHNAIVAEVYPDREYVEKNGITDVYAHLKPYIDEYNRNAVPYKKIGVLKVREEEFPKNTLRKIMRFKLDMSID